MHRILFILLPISVLLAGCAKKMSGVYEAVPAISQVRIPGIDANTRRQMDAQYAQVQSMNRMTLEFSGSKVKMGTTSAISEYRYRVDGKRLEIISEAMGQKTVIPMIIEDDGSITYQTLRFYRKK